MIEQESKKEYQKKYYEEHKDKMNKQSGESQKTLRVDKMVINLNSGKYKRIPYSKIKKYGIKYDEITKIYSF